MVCAELDRQWPGVSLDRVLQSVKQSSQPLIASYTICAIFCLLQLNCASLAARVDVCILDCLTVRWAGRPVFTDVQLLSAMSLLTEAVLQTCTHLRSMLHTGEHHNIMQIFQRGYMVQKHLAYNQPVDWALQTFHTKLASSSSSGP